MKKERPVKVNWSETPEANAKYVVTPRQIAEIVAYCVRMTAAGSDNHKDWNLNVLTAIKGINGIEYSDKKIDLTPLS